MKNNKVKSNLTKAILAVIVGLGFPGLTEAASSKVSFKADIQPIFDEYCVSCHVPGEVGFEASGFDLSTYAGVMKGTRFGAMIVPGSPLSSNLMAVLEGRTDASIRMPHSDRREMTKLDRRILRKWIIGGATKADYEEKGAVGVIEDLCLDCHVPDGMGYEASGLDLRSYESLMKGTRHGSIIVPGDPFMSNLMVLIEGRAAGGLKMPHNDQEAPTAKDRNTLRRWINKGALNN
ncbi:MAG: hypothetical protein COB46_11100 [Rhodospirillaceae bacterium]|nr:MAG: hypothetical protein COB46_11100 [Rhodospirillaceae bacterium]